MIDTYSAFYYGYRVTAQPYNGYMNINEGGGAITVAIPAGSYTLNTIVDAIRNALLTQATLAYTVTVDRATRKITLSADAPFSLLIDSGANVGSSIWSLIGFTGADRASALTHTSNTASGFAYYPQFPLQSYVAHEDYQGRNQASKNIASDGTTVEVISFGLAKFIEFDIKFITSRSDVADGVLIKKNSRGLEDARAFLQDITNITQFEFMPDRNAPGTFSRCIVEAMPEFTDGTGYKLRELFNENLRDIYETGLMKLRVIE